MAMDRGDVEFNKSIHDILEKLLAEDQELLKDIRTVLLHNDTVRQCQAKNYLKVSQLNHYVFTPLMVLENHFAAFVQKVDEAVTHSLQATQFRVSDILEIFLKMRYPMELITYAKTYLRAQHLFEIIVKEYPSYATNLPATSFTKEKGKKSRIYEPELDVYAVLKEPLFRPHIYMNFVKALRDKIYLDYPELIDKVSALVEDVTDAVDTLFTDGEDMKVLEQVQNNIYHLPFDFLDEIIEDAFYDTAGFRRSMLWHYGKLRMHGLVHFRVSLTKSVLRFMVMVDQLLVVCKVESKSPRPYEYITCSQHFIFSRKPNAQKSFTLTIGTGEDVDTYKCKAESVDDLDQWMMAYENVSQLPRFTGNEEHGWALHTFTENKKCDVCHKILKGAVCQGYKCFPRGSLGRGCGMSVHAECFKDAPQTCAKTFQKQEGAMPGGFTWDAGDMPQHYADQLVIACPETTFLIRNEPDGMYLTFGYRDPQTTAADTQLVPTMAAANLLIRTDESAAGRKFFYLGEMQGIHPKYDTLADLVEGYQTRSDLSRVFRRLEDRYVKLGEPYQSAVIRERRRRGTLYFDWMARPLPIEILLQAEILTLPPIFYSTTTDEPL